MGYTHYWSFTAPKRGETAKIEKAYQKAIKECATIARTYYLANGGLSGFSAHTEPGKYGGLKINGKGDLSHEDFTMREYFKENLKPDSFNFCKTARKPYDVVVVACLIVLANRLPNNFSASSDGYTDEWQAGLELARRVLKDKTLSIPKTVREYQGPRAKQLPRFQLYINGQPVNK
jgi:hypothetical protein